MHEVDAAVINYSGEEVLPMRPLTVEQMEPGLPPAGAGGRVSACDLVDPGTKLFLSDPSLSFLPVEEVEEGPCQAAVHVEAGSHASVARLLVERGVCRPLRRCEVGQFKGRPVLNGLFGVPKPKLLSGGRPILRTIINLIPSNRIQRVIGGHINCLPSITKWQSIILWEMVRPCWHISATWLVPSTCLRCPKSGCRGSVSTLTCLVVSWDSLQMNAAPLPVAPCLWAGSPLSG